MHKGERWKKRLERVWGFWDKERVMSEWKEYELSDAIISINTGLDAIRRAPIVNYETSIRCLRIQDISQDKPFSEWGFTDVNTKDFEKYQLQKNDIIIARTGNSIGVNILIKSRLSAVFNNGLARIRVNPNVALSEFIFYLMQTQNFRKYIDAISSGTATQPNMKVGDLSKYKINLPDIETQKKIINHISPIYKKIELNTQTNQTLEQIAQGIFKHWFIDIAPVHAKANALAAGTSPEQAELATMASLSGKTLAEITALQHTAPEAYHQLQQTARAFPSEFVESEMGLVPKGWEIENIGNIANVIKGKSYKSNELTHSTTALVTLKSFNRGGGYRIDGLKEYSGKYKPEQEVYAGELIIAYTDVTQAADIIGKPAMVMSNNNYEHLVISLDVAVVRPKNQYLKYFLYCLAMTERFHQHTKSFCSGTTVLHLGKNAVPSFQFAIPNQTLLIDLDKKLRSIFEKINLNIQENESLTKTRDELLPKLLNGEIEL